MRGEQHLEPAGRSYSDQLRGVTLGEAQLLALLFLNWLAFYTLL